MRCSSGRQNGADVLLAVIFALCASPGHHEVIERNYCTLFWHANKYKVETE